MIEDVNTVPPSELVPQLIGSKIFYDINLFLLKIPGMSPWGQLDSVLITQVITNGSIGGLFGVPVALTNSYPETPAPSADWYSSIIGSVNSITDRLNVPRLFYAISAAHGAAFINEATVIPHQIGIAASFNRSAAWTGGRITASDARGAGITMVTNPSAQLATNPAWPSTYETFGEDARHVGVMTENFVHGLQYHNGFTFRNVVATIKGFGGGNPRNGNYRGNTWVPNNIYAQHYSLPYRARQENEKWNLSELLQRTYHFVMLSNLPINGAPVASSELYLKTFLNFIGNISQPGSFPLFVTEPDEIWSWVNEYFLVSNVETATALMLRQCLIDVILVTDLSTIHIGNVLLNAYKNLVARVDLAEAAHAKQQRDGASFQRLDIGSNMYFHAVSEELQQVKNNLQKNSLRQMRARELLGINGSTSLQLNNIIDNKNLNCSDPSAVTTKQDKEDEAYHLARQSIVLLENKLMGGNQKTLPIVDLEKKTVALIGRGCNSLSLMSGGQTGKWQGLPDEDMTAFTGGKSSTVKDGLERIALKVMYSVGCADISDSADAYCNLELVTEAVDNAQNADVAVVCVGELPYYGAAGDISETWLPSDQIEMIEQIASVNNNTIVILFQGRNRLLDTIPAKVAALLHAYLPGPQGGRAVVDILSGIYVPSGRLPLTYLKYPVPGAEGGAQHWRRFGSEYSDIVQYPYGYGLSYSSFEYSNALGTYEIEYEPVNKTVTDILFNLSVNITNTGKFDADHRVVCFMFADPTSAPLPPSSLFLTSASTLFDFRALHLKMGESQQIVCRGRATNIIKPNTLCELPLLRKQYRLSANSVGHNTQDSSEVSVELYLPDNLSENCRFLNRTDSWSGVVYSPGDAIMGPLDDAFDFVLPGLVCVGAGIVSAVTIVTYCRRRAARVASTRTRSSTERERHRRRKKQH